MSATELPSTERVCPTCGLPPGDQGFCAHCGTNLAKVKRLLTRDEWLAGRHRRSATRRTLLVGASVLVVLVAAVVLIVVTQRSDTRTLQVPSESMMPTFNVGDRLTVNTSAYDNATPKIGDIIVFHPPYGADTNTCGDQNKTPDQACASPTPGLSGVNFFKRIVAGPGDTLYIKGGHAHVAGKLQDDRFTRPCAGGTGCDFSRPITIPPDHWFTLGDNRGESDDSRFWGAVPTQAIMGRVDTCAPLNLFCHAKR